jgi:hypothetical protein
VNKNYSDIENIFKILGLDFSEIKVAENPIKTELMDMDYLLKTKNAKCQIEKFFYINTLLTECSFFKQIKPSIRLKIKIIKWISQSLGYRI